VCVYRVRAQAVSLLLFPYTFGLLYTLCIVCFLVGYSHAAAHADCSII